MADSNVNINVSANTGGAVNALNKVTSAMSKISSNIDKTSKKMYNFGHTIQEFGQNMYSIGQRATIGISAPLAGLGKTLIETGSSMKAMHNTFKISFGNMSDEAMAWSKQLSKSVGLTSGIIDETNLQFRKMAGAFGLTGKEALTFSEKWTKLTLDVAAFNDIPISEATDRMMSGLRGEADAVEKLGIFMGEANLKAQMLSMGIKGQYSALSQTQKMSILYALAMKQTAQANGQASREAVSFQNSLANLKQTFKEFAENFYIAVEPAVLDYMKQLNSLIEKLKKLSPEQMKFYANLAKWLIIIPPIIMYIGALVEGIGRLFKVFSFAGKIIKFFADWESVAIRLMYLWDGVVVAWGAVSGALTTIGTAIMGVLEAIALALEISVGAVIAIIAGIAVAVFLIIKYWDEIRAWTIKAWSVIAKWLSDVWKSITIIARSTWTSITDYLSGVWKSIVSLFNQYVMPIVNTATNIFNSVVAVITSFGQSVLNVLCAIGGFFKYVWIDVISPVIQYVGSIFKALGELVVWCIQQLIGMAIQWFADKWKWLYNSVIVPVGTAIGDFFKSMGQWFVTVYKNSIIPAINGIRSAWSTLCQAFIYLYDTYIIPVITGFKVGWSTIVSVFKGFMASLKSGWQSFVSSLGSLWNSYGVPVLNGIKTIANTVVSSWNAALTNAKIAFQRFTDGIATAWQSIKSVFKLPHINVSGGWDLTPPSISVPKLSVNWYAKGGIFSEASMIGVGEAGDEAVIPLNNKSKVAPFASAVAGQFLSMLPDTAFEDGKSDGSGVVINVDSLVVREEADIDRIAEKLYKLQERNRRAKGGHRNV